ncbi:hypothetical protein M514_24940, partial [Trichuris suis]
MAPSLLTTLVSMAHDWIMSIRCFGGGIVDVTRAINDGDLCTVNSHDRVYWFSQKPDHKYFVVCITPANYLFQSVWIGTLSNGCVEIHN